MLRNSFVVAVAIGMLAFTHSQTAYGEEQPLPTIEEVKEKMHLGEPLTDADKKVLADFYNQNQK